MVNTKEIYDTLFKNQVEFFTGVPDSLLKDICAYITDNTPKERHVIAANEGGAIALATGYHLASGKIPLVYMQNSGIGNAINPLLSLVDKAVYSIPMLLMIGWRGEPGVKDEPQHIKQGEVTLDLLEAMKIPYLILSDNIEDAKMNIENAVAYTKNNNSPYAFIIRKGIFESYKLLNANESNYSLTREGAIEIILNRINNNDIIVSTTGMASRELFELRKKHNLSHKNDFLTVGSMGHASQIALGIAIEKPNRKVYCFDGDGSVLMHTGSMGIIGDLSPKNLKHIIFNNGAHDSVGGQPTIGFNTNFLNIAKAFNYKETYQAINQDELENKLLEFIEIEGPALLEILIQKGARKDLGRPTETPNQNKISLMNNLSN